jgi:hypothetical protein
VAHALDRQVNEAPASEMIPTSPTPASYHDALYALSSSLTLSCSFEALAQCLKQIGTHRSTGEAFRSMILINLLLSRFNTYPKFSYQISYPGLARIAISCQRLAGVSNMPLFLTGMHVDPSYSILNHSASTQPDCSFLAGSTATHYLR